MLVGRRKRGNGALGTRRCSAGGLHEAVSQKGEPDLHSAVARRNEYIDEALNRVVYSTCSGIQLLTFGSRQLGDT
jgi:hypothetical protein